MSTVKGEDRNALWARLEDLCAAAQKGEMRITPFLSPKDCHDAEVFLKARGVSYAVYGGYMGAERCRVYVLPDYMESLGQLASSDGSESNDGDIASNFEEQLSAFGLTSQISVLSIKGSGYRDLTHRDFLGALLGLGLERGVLGDMLVEVEAKSAVLFCEETIGRFLLQELTQVGNDKVKVLSLGAGEWTLPERHMLPIGDTVASPRLDCIVAALCGLSREKAGDAVRRGLVELNFEREERPDHTVTVPAQLSVRGFGRYRILSLSERTRKGRFRLTAEKYL